MTQEAQNTGNPSTPLRTPPKEYLKEAENVIFSLPDKSREEQLAVLSQRISGMVHSGMASFDPIQAEMALDEALKTF